MAMQLSAIMNLTGNFAAQIQKNVDSMKGIKDQADQAAKSIKTAFSESNIGQGLTKGLAQTKDAFGAAGIASIGFLKACTDSAGKAQKTNADLAQTIKSTGGAAGMTADEVSKMDIEISKTNLASAGMIKEGDNMLLTFTNIGKEVIPMATQSMVDLAQKMGGAPKDSAIQLGKALNDPTTGLTALTRVGVTFTEQQKNQIKAMQSAGDMAGAQKVILSELNKEFGGQSAAALNTYDGQMTKLIQTVGGIKSAIGTTFLPYLQQVAEKLNSGAQAVSKFVTEHKQLIAVVLGLTAVFGTLIGGVGLFTKISMLMGPAVTGITALIGGLTFPILLVIGAIAALVYAYTQNFGGIKDFIDGVIGGIISTFKMATDVFKSNGDAIGAIGIFIKNIFGDDVANTVMSTMTTIKDIVMSLIDTVKQHMPQIKEVISNVFQGIQSVYNSALKPVLSFMIATIGQVVQWVVTNWPLIQNTIVIVMKYIYNIIQSYLNSIKVFWNEHGEAIMAIVSNAFDAIKTIISTVIKAIEGIIKTVMLAINGDWSGAWSTLCSTVGTIFSGAVDVIWDILKIIGNIFKEIAVTAITWGKDMVMGIVDGIKGAIGYVGDAVVGVADKIKSFLHFSVPDQGPLVNYQQWMPDFLQGMGQGIKVSTHFVTDPIKDLSLGIKTNTKSGLTIGGQSSSGPSKNNGGGNVFTIAKLADQIIVREESDIDKIATALANKLVQTQLGMA